MSLASDPPQIVMATPEGTRSFAAKKGAAPGHFREWRSLAVSSLGVGTYLGEVGEAANRNYEEAVLACLDGGVNVIDTAINYRDQQSERDVGRALRRHGRRGEVVVATKGGFLHGDSSEPDGRDWFARTYIETGILRPEDIVNGSHAIAPAYLRHELERSLDNLQLGAVDVYFVHNPESQLEAGIARSVFDERLREAFVELELQCDAGRVGSYGVATWDGLRIPTSSHAHLSLERLVGIAHEARVEVGGGGNEHHFGAVELPINLGMPEAAAARTQLWQGRQVTLLEAASAAGVAVFASATLLQARLLGRLDERVRGTLAAPTDFEAALDFTRSLPGVTTALVGMGDPEHARSNAAAARTRAPCPEAATKLLLP